VGNELHWSLDVTFGEDKNKTTKGHAGTNLELGSARWPYHF